MNRSFLDRPLEGGRPCLWLDTTYAKMCQTGRIVPDERAVSRRYMTLEFIAPVSDRPTVKLPAVAG